MARRKLPEEEQVENPPMTPMIDIVFQLIIFFMLIMDMSKQQIEPVILPYASKAIKEKFADPHMLILNVLEDGTIKIQGRRFWDPSKEDDNQRLEDLFESRRQNRIYQEVPGKDDWVKYPMLIRADRSTAFEHLQKILMIATKHGGVTNVQLGAKQEMN